MACSSNEQIQNAQKALEEVRADDALCEQIFYEWLKENDEINRQKRMERMEKQIEEKAEYVKKLEKSVEDGKKELEDGKKKLEDEQKKLKESKKQFVLGLLKTNMSMEQITSITGFLKEEIDELIGDTKD